MRYALPLTLVNGIREIRALAQFTGTKSFGRKDSRAKNRILRTNFETV